MPPDNPPKPARRTSPIIRNQEGRTLAAPVWLVPFAYGALLFLAGPYWLLFGSPFDQATYERIGGMPWTELESRLGHTGTPVVAALIRLLGGNGAVLGGGLAMAVAFFGLRTARPWACFALWLLPLHSVVDLCVVAIAGGLRAAVAVWDIGSALALSTSLVLARRQLIRAQSH